MTVFVWTTHYSGLFFRPRASDFWTKVIRHTNRASLSVPGQCCLFPTRVCTANWIAADSSFIHSPHSALVTLAATSDIHILQFWLTCSYDRWDDHVKSGLDFGWWFGINVLRCDAQRKSRIKVDPSDSSFWRPINSLNQIQMSSLNYSCEGFSNKPHVSILWWEPQTFFCFTWYFFMKVMEPFE